MVSVKIYCLIALLLMAGCASTQPVTKSASAYFQEGEELYASKHYEDAIEQWKKVKESYLSPELTTRAELNIADAQFESGSYIEAAASYEDFRKLHPTHDKAPYALYKLGLCYFDQITGIDTDQTPVKNAVATFELFLRQYPDSKYIQEVRDNLEVCRDKQFQYEIYVGSFYLRTENYKAAIQRLQEALARYPKSTVGDEALFYLGQAFMLSGNRTEGREAFARLTNQHDSSRYIEKAKKFMEKYY